MVARSMMANILHGHPRRQRGQDVTEMVDENVKKIPGAIVTDAKSVYDGVEKRESFSAGLQDRRSGIETVAIRQQIRDQEVKAWWTNSDQQVADGLTKVEARMRYVEWIRRGEVCLRHDPEFTSAKKVRQKQREEEGYAWRVPEKKEQNISPEEAAFMIMKLKHQMEKIKWERDQIEQKITSGRLSTGRSSSSEDDQESS